MAKDSSCCGDVKMVLACSGGSNVGQITNEVAISLDSSDAAKFSCLAGVGGGLSGFIESTKGAESVLVLGGCQVACGKACMERAGLDGYGHIIVTDLDIEKKHEFKNSPGEIAKVIAAAKEKLGVRKNG